MRRRSIGPCIAIVSSLVIVQGVVAVSLLPAVAGAVAPRTSICQLNASAIPGLARAARGCRWHEISRAADERIVHQHCTITGTEADDVLHGTNGRDVICGYQGDDVIKARGGRDVVYGGSGQDRVRGGPGGDDLWGEEGNDRLLGGQAGDDLFGQQGNDRLVGAGWSDSIAGGYGNDFMSGGPATDFVDDTFGSDVAMLGAGADLFTSLRGVDRVYAGRGNDLCLTVADGRPGDFIDGGPGTEDRFDADASDSWSAVEIGPEICNAC
jgi:hypothetical protein